MPGAQLPSGSAIHSCKAVCAHPRVRPHVHRAREPAGCNAQVKRRAARARDSQPVSKVKPVETFGAGERQSVWDVEVSGAYTAYAG